MVIELASVGSSLGYKSVHSWPLSIGAWQVVYFAFESLSLHNNPFLHCPKPTSQFLSSLLPLHLVPSQTPEVHLLSLAHDSPS